MLRNFLLYIHIISVIASIGPFFTTIPLVKKMRQAEKAVLEAYLDAFKYAVFLTKHAGHVLVGSGILLVLVTGWTWKTPWIITTVVILMTSLFFLARAFSPILRKFTEDGQDKELLAKKLMRTTLAYIFILLFMLWFMVAKPMLW